MMMAYAQEQVNEDMDLAETKHYKGYYGGYWGGYPGYGYNYPRYYHPKGRPTIYFKYILEQAIPR